MSENKQEILKIEKEIESLIKKRSNILSVDRPLLKEEVDRLFDINLEIDWQFEQQSMLLPLIEDKKTWNRWNPSILSFSTDTAD